LSKTGNFAPDPRTLRRALRTVLLILGLGFLGACTGWQNVQDQLGNGPEGYPRSPDITDRVRSLDLLPRSPQPGAGTDQAGGFSARTQVYQGDQVPGIQDGTERSPPAVTAEDGDGVILDTGDNASIAAVAKSILGDTLHLNYTIDPRVMGMVSLSSSGRKVPKKDVLFVLENALRLSGVVMVKDLHGFRLIPLGDAVGAGNLDSADRSPEAGYGVSVVPLQYVSASTLLKLIDSFATKPGTVRADTARNLLLIQGTGAERKVAVDTVLGFDVDWMRGQSVGVFPIRNTAPEPIVGELEKILDTGEGGLSQNTVKLQPINRMNAILVVTRKPGMLRTVETWIRRLDATDTARASVHVYHVKYGEARQLARVLNDIFTGGGSLDSAAGQVGPRLGITQSTDRLSPGSGGSGAGSAGSAFGTGGLGGAGTGVGSNSGGIGLGGAGRTGGQGGFGANSTLGRQSTDTAALEGRTPGGGANGQPVLEGVRITADQAANKLLIYASTEQYQIIARSLVQLDRPQLQVAIDATIAEVTLNDNLSYGVQFFLNKSSGSLAGSISNIPTNNNNSSAGSSTNSLFGGSQVGAALSRAFPAFNLMVGNDNLPKMVLDALHAVTTTKVLSNPSLVVIDNQVATLMVGNDVPISTGSANVLTATNTVVNTIDYRSTGLILRVLPHVNVNGNVRLEIEQEISNVAQTNLGVTGNPTFSQRKVKSTIGVQNGQTVLLAGLIQEEKDTDRGGIPLLDEIRGLGDAFSHQSKTGQRTELIIFIRPQIIRDSTDASFVAEELRTKLRGTIGSLPPDLPPQGPKHR
jgi:general secretion pathway protein D